MTVRSRISFAAPALDLSTLGFESPLLYIDADAERRERRTRALEAAGFPVLGAESSDDALSVLEAIRPKLIILAGQSPAPPTDLLTAFRGGQPAGTSLLVTSPAFADAAARADALEMGADACLAEPVTLVELLATVRARLRAELQERERRLAYHRRLVQNQIGMIVAAGEDPHAARASILETLCTAYRWKVGELWVPSDTDETLRYGGGWSDPADELMEFVEISRGHEFPPDEGLPWIVNRRREPVWVPDVASHPLFRRAEVTRRFGLRSALAAPLPLPSGRTAALVLFSAHSAHPDQATLDAITEASAHLARLIEPPEGGAVAGPPVDPAEVLRQKDTLLETVAHELRQPLTALQAAAWLLRARADEDQCPSSRALDVLCRQTVRLAHIVGDLLDTALYNQGRLTITCRDVRIDELARRVVDDVRPEFSAGGLTVSCAGVPVAARADGERIQQVLWNLLDNARKCTPGGGWVHVSVAAEPEAAVLRVRDTGRGIPEDELGSVFEIVRQANAAQRAGLGLGLAVVRMLVTLHGGTVEAHSAGRNRGSEFVVRLPLVGDADTG